MRLCKCCLVMGDSENVLAEALGEAAAHEMAAGQLGFYLKQDKLESRSLDGDEVAQRLPDYNEVLGHFGAYTSMLDEIGEEANDWVPTGKTYMDTPLLDGDISEQDALLAGYVLERQAREYANEAIAIAEDSGMRGLVSGTTDSRQDSLSDISAEENEEMRDIEKLLVGDSDYDFDDRDQLLDQYETLDDI